MSIVKVKDWTVGANGRSNTSEAFNRLVSDVARVIRDHRIGDDPEQTARLIVARLAHIHGVGPLVASPSAEPPQ